MTIGDQIKKLIRQLLPTGRAWNVPEDGPHDKLITALSLSQARLAADVEGLLDSILPDNDNFTADDATRWEERLGLITNEAVSLADRKLAIRRKMNHPGKIPARQNYGYLQDQLQAAGFNVYVYENIFSDGMGGFVTMNPTDIIGPNNVGIAIHSDDCEHGDHIEHGDSTSGAVYEDCVANYINELLDAWFDTGDNLRNTFFIAGPYIDQFADVPEERKEEFRQLILRLKPLQTVAFLFVNYTT